MEYYLSQLNSESYNNGTQYFKLQDEYVKLNKLIGELEQLDNALQTAQNELDQLHQQQVLSPPVSDSYTTNTNATEPSVPPMLYVKDNLETKKSELATKIETIKSNITAKNSEIEGQKMNIKDMERSYNTYVQLISELGTARSNNGKSITELEANLGIAAGQDKANSILATSDGILHYIVPLKQGMAIQQDKTVAEISEKEKGYYVEAFVGSSDISRVSKGAKVDVAIAGVNIQKYGTLQGKVMQIDFGTISQETKEGHISLYKVIVQLESLTLKHKSKSIFPQKDMPVEVRIVYDNETYFDWILEMLRFKQ